MTQVSLYSIFDEWHSQETPFVTDLPTNIRNIQHMVNIMFREVN